MQRARLIAMLTLVSIGASPVAAEPVQYKRGAEDRITVVARETPIGEVLEMLARKERINIVLGQNIDGNVSVNLFDVRLADAVRAIAEAGGYVALRRRGGWAVVPEDRVDQSTYAATRVRVFKIQYSDPERVASIVEKHLSRYGELTVFPERRMLVVEDLPSYVARVADVLRDVDFEPRQILLQTKILEITLRSDETYGINWVQLLQDGETGDVGVQGLAALGTPGFFFDFVKSGNLQVALTALSSQSRVRTLSSPTVLAIEGHEAEVVIGDRLGFRVTTTINQVTTESVEFLESGVILRVKAAVDDRGRILLEVHPEVSSGTIDDGLPNQTTAEVTTHLLVESGQTVLLGGLLKDRVTEAHSGARWLKDIPIIGWLFSRREELVLMTETVAIVTAHVVAVEDERGHPSVPLHERELSEIRRSVEDRYAEEPNAPTGR